MSERNVTIGDVVVPIPDEARTLTEIVASLRAQNVDASIVNDSSVSIPMLSPWIVPPSVRIVIPSVDGHELTQRSVQEAINHLVGSPVMSLSLRGF